MSGVGQRTTRKPWQRPVLRGVEDHRQVGWLELFFDLVFVVIVSMLAQDLAHHLTGPGVRDFVLQFLAVFWIWNAFTYYSERFESDGLETRVFTFLALLAVAGLAIWAADGLGQHYLGFALSYAAARLLNIGMWLRAAYYNPIFRGTAFSFAGGFAVAFGLIGLSFLTDGSLRLVVWGAAIVLDILTPAIFNRLQWKLPAISRDKYPERFGLLTMIILGEVVASVIGGIAEVHTAGELTGATVVSGAVGLAIGFGLWWIYYDFIGRRIPYPPLPIQLAWIYLHFFLLIGLVAVGVGVEIALIESRDGTMSTEVQTVLLLAEALTLVAVGAMEFTLERADDEPTHPIVSPAIKIGVAVLLAALLSWQHAPTIAILACCAVALAVPASYGAFVWFRKVR